MRRLLLSLSFLCLAGCETVSYYSQAIRGQLGLVNAARPVSAWLADPATPPDLRQRLESAQRIRDFGRAPMSYVRRAGQGTVSELQVSGYTIRVCRPS